MLPVQGDSLLGAGADTGAAAGAAGEMAEQLVLEVLALWIVAPAAVDGAALKEYRGTDSLSIVDGILLNVKD